MKIVKTTGAKAIETRKDEKLSWRGVIIEIN